jgi:DNA-binding transcriptional LysR family regulator
MHYRHLYYFVRIVEAGSFSQAARTIHVAQPALSQQIAELEASLGVPLLQRSARGVKPTAAGQKFYDEASSILRKYENLPSLVRSNSGKVDGRVSLGMPASLSTTLVGPFIEACKADYQASRRAAGALSRGGWRQRAGPVVGVHSGLHRHTDRLERPERTVCRTATPGRATLRKPPFPLIVERYHHVALQSSSKTDNERGRPEPARRLGSGAGC